MTTTGRLRAYRIVVNGWVAGKIVEADVDNFVRARWITKEEGEEIKLLRRNDTEAADRLLERFRLIVES